MSAEQDADTLADILEWLAEHDESALDLAVSIIADQTSKIAPEIIAAEDEDGLSIRLEVYKGHHAAARQAQVEHTEKLSTAEGVFH